MNSVALVFVLVLAGKSVVSAAEKELVTVEDCVCTRRIVGKELALSPTGSHVAYIVKAPDVPTNKNNYQLYVRDLTQRTRRENGRLLVQSEDLSGVRWLAAGNQVAVLSREGDRSTVKIIDINSERAELAVDHPVRIEEYSINAHGDVVVFSTKLPPPSDATQDRAKKTRGFHVTFGQPLNRSIIETFHSKYELYAAERTKSHKRTVRRLKFNGLGMEKEHSLATWHLIDLSLSPDGKYLLFAYRATELPEGWETTHYVKRIREYGGPYLVILYDLQSSQLHLAFNAPYRFGATTWADDSRAFAIQINSPIGSPEYQKEEEAALALGDVLTLGNEAPLFAVDVKSGSFTQVLPKLPRVTRGGIPLVWKRSDGPMFCRVDERTLVWMSPQGSEWKEVSGTTLSLPRNNTNYRIAGNGDVVVSISETPMVPPDLFLYDIKTDQTTLLTDLNSEFSQITLGQVEEVKWTNKYGAETKGYLIKPVGYETEKQYPLVILTKTWTSTFICDTNYQTAFPPQPLASAGFVVLMAKNPSAAEQPKDYPGAIGEAYNWNAMVESAIEFLVGQGLVDKDNVGLMGFSRTSWKTDFILTHSDFSFAAASSADSGINTYGIYWILNSQAHMAAYEAELGGPPYGETFQNWLEYAPAFNAQNMQTPVLMEYTGSAGLTLEPTHAYEFFTALKRQGKPVELYFYPQGEHQLDTPFERVASLQRNVDWFRFWMQDYEGTAPEYDPEQYIRWRALRRLHQENQQKLTANQRE